MKVEMRGVGACMTWGMNSGGCVEASGMGDGRGEIGDYCYDMMGMMDMMDDHVTYLLSSLFSPLT